LIFLLTHFGKHLKYGWTRMSDFYSGLEVDNTWSWVRTCNNKSEFDYWFNNNYQLIRGGFGNHRKYMSIRPNSNMNVIDVISSYIEWVGTNNSHADLINNVTKLCVSNSTEMFHYFYNSLNSVVSFGRTGRFDFLTMLAKTGVVDIVPGYAYLKGATGPLTGAKLLLTGNRASSINISALEGSLSSINDRLSIGIMGMQVLEDSLCNWDKSPNIYFRFRG